jgi:preprotein translocase subunit SecE
MAREAGLGGFPADRAPGEVQKARRGGPFGFIAESVAELKKVEWPGQSQVIQGTVVVLGACVIVGVYLY